MHIDFMKGTCPQCGRNKLCVDSRYDRGWCNVCAIWAEEECDCPNKAIFGGDNSHIDFSDRENVCPFYKTPRNPIDDPDIKAYIEKTKS